MPCELINYPITVIEGHHPHLAQIGSHPLTLERYDQLLTGGAE